MSKHRLSSTLNAYWRLVRLHQRTGIWLLLLPCLWSIAFTAEDFSVEVQKILFIFTIGSVIMRSAGCIINDVWDRNIDAHVERTRTRPLANKEVSVSGALILFFILIGIGLFLLLKLNAQTIWLGVIFSVMVVIYPLTKRFINMPQLFLGLTFNAGALMGVSALTGQLTVSAWLLYIACISWTLAYDTIYAHQDKKDDIKIGVKSSALTLGKNTKKYVSIYYAIMVVMWNIVGALAGVQWLFYVGSAILFIVLFNKTRRVDLDNATSCLNLFRFNVVFGFALLCLLILDKLISLNLVAQ